MFVLHTGDSYLGYETGEFPTLDAAMLALKTHCLKVQGKLGDGDYVSAIIYDYDAKIHYNRLVRFEGDRFMVKG